MDKLKLTPDQIVSKNELQMFLTAFVDVVNKTKIDFETQNKDSLDTLDRAISLIEEKIAKTDVLNETITSNASILNKKIENDIDIFNNRAKEITNNSIRDSINSLKSFIESEKSKIIQEINQGIRNGEDGTDGIDGKDADEEKIMEEILSKIKKETPESVRDMLESLEGDDRLDASAIKNLPETKIINNHTGGAAKQLQYLSDVKIQNLTGGEIIAYNEITGFWENIAQNVSLVRCKNTTGTTIGVGKIVYITGATGGNPNITLAGKGSEATSSKTFGITTQSINNNAIGLVITEGEYKFLGISISYPAGTMLWLGDNGDWTDIKPSAPDNLVFVGYVLTSGNNPKLYVKIQNGYELDELHNVSITAPTTGQQLQYENGLWKNK